MGWKQSGGASVSVPNDLTFTGENLAATQTARDAFFTANPSRKQDKVRVLLQPTGAPIVLQQWDSGVTTWRDQTSVVQGPPGVGSGLSPGATGTPTARQVPIASSGTAAAWGSLTAADVGALASAMVGAASGAASLGADGKHKLSEIPDGIVAGLKWQGTWNATTNTPTVPAAATGNNGFFYRVSTAGTSSITGSSVAFGIGDWLISNGTAWQRVENTMGLVNDLTTGGTTVALAAAQGVALKALVDGKPALASAAPADLAATANVGTAPAAARADHVHALPSAATTSASGLMSATDKTKLDGIATGATALALASAAPAALAATAAVGNGTNAARDNHVHRYPDGLHNGTRQIAGFSGTEYYVEGPTAAKTRILLKDTDVNLVVNNLSRFWADGSWTIARGPAGTDAASHKLHMSNTETVLHAKGGKARVAVYEGETILRSPAATDADGTFVRLYDEDISMYRKGNYRLGLDANNTWAHSPDSTWRTWLYNSGYTINRTGTGDMLLLSQTSSSVRNSWALITSDQRLKTPLRDVPEVLLDAWGKHVKWGVYNWLEKDPEKADQKAQSGLIAQHIVAAFDEAGIDWRGWKVVEYVEDEDRYGVCYDHCNAIENAYQRRRLDRLEARLKLTTLIACV